MGAQPNKLIAFQPSWAARPAQSEATKRLQSSTNWGASGAEGRRWVDHDHREATPSTHTMQRDALPMGSRETLHPSDNRHSASSAKNSDENQVAAIQRKAKPKTREQGKSNKLQ